MKGIVFLLSAFLLVYHSLAFSHGGGGGPSSSWTPKIKVKQEPITPTKTLSERMRFSLKTQEYEVKLWVSNEFNEAIDTSLSSATVFLTENGQTKIFKMLPTDHGHLIGTLPIKTSSSAKFEITLRMPGERPITLSFKPGQNEQPTKISQ